MYLIYKITSPSGRVYVGKTKNLTQRMRVHKSAALKGKHFLIARSINKYGFDNHLVEVIETVGSESMLSEREIYWISTLGTYCYENKMGLNMTRGGDGQTSEWKHDIERVAKQSSEFSGSGNPFFGKKHTDETRKFLSDYSKIRNKREGRIVPKWGAEKGWEAVRKKVVCYTFMGEFIAEYNSVTEASRALGVLGSSISSVCKGKSNHVGGYVFNYKDESTSDDSKIIFEKKINIKAGVLRPIYWLSEDLEPICEFPSAKEASEFFSIPKTTISRAAQYNDLNPIRLGHIFCYKDEYLEEYKLVS